MLLRLYTLLERPAWEDEMWTLRNIYTSSWPELFRVAFEDYWPPLHYVILNAVARVADTSLVSLRGPSVVFGVAAVAAMYPLGMELFRRRFPALVATALLAGMTSHVLYSQEARVYSLQVLLVILSALYFFRSWRQQRISPAFLLTTTLLTYSHSFSSWYFIAAQGAFLLLAWAAWRDTERFRKGFVSQLLVLVLWLPLVGAFRPRAVRPGDRGAHVLGGATQGAPGACSTWSRSTRGWRSGRGPERPS
jgi:mannosyltransferase